MNIKTSLIILLFSFLLISGCTINRNDNVKIDDVYSDEITTSSSGEDNDKVIPANPNYRIENSSGDEMFKVDHEGHVWISQIINCDTINTDGDGSISCGNQSNLDTNHSNSTDYWGSYDSWDDLINLNPSNTRIVCKTGCNYSTIQGAIDSISDASSTKKYVVLVYSGIYNENIVGKYVPP